MTDPISILAAINPFEQAVVRDLVVILTTASLVALVMQRLRLAVIPAYLIAGAIVGPRAVRLVPDPQGLGVILHLAIVLLLFGIGLELHLSALRYRLAQIVLSGSGCVVFCTMLAWPVAMTFGLSAPGALAVAMALSLSSTAVVLRILADRRELQRITGRLSLATLVIQDLAVLGMLAAMPLLAKWAGGATAAVSQSAESAAAAQTWLRSALDAMLRLGGIVLVAIAGGIILPRVFGEALKSRSTEVLMVIGVAAALGTAVAAEALGFSLEMGAFLGGFILAGTPFRHHLSGQIGPLRDVFIAVFFTTVGMKLDPAVILQYWWVVLLALSMLLLLKGAVITGTCWACGATFGSALAVGMILAQAGEFSLVLLASATEVKLIGPSQLAVIIGVVVVSLIVTPSLISLGQRLSVRLAHLGTAPWARSSPLTEPPSDPQHLSPDAKHVVVAGFGPVGRQIVDRLQDRGLSYAVVELNMKTVEREGRQGKRFVFGDVSNREVLESAGIDHADALILTIPDEAAVLRACAIARRHRPDIYIAARASFVRGGEAALKAGADHVIVDETETAEAMVRDVVVHIEPEESEATDPIV